MRSASLFFILSIFFCNTVSSSKVKLKLNEKNLTGSELKQKRNVTLKVVKKVKQTNFTIVGNKRVSEAKILAIIGKERDPRKLQDLLFTSGLFKTVKVSVLDNDLKIIVKEEPVISKIDFRAKGTYFIETKPFLENLNIKAGDMFNRDKLNRATEIVRQMTISMTNTKKVRVNVKQILEPDNQMRLMFDVTVQQTSRIRKANFIGNKKLSSSELYRNLNKTKVLQHPIPFVGFEELNQLNLYEHKASLEKYAASRGFLDFKVKNVSIVEDHFNILVEEGTQYKINKIRLINECTELATSCVQKYIKTLQSGDVCNTDTVERVRIAISKALIARGLNRYRVRTEFNKKGQTVDLQFKIYFDDASFKVKRIVVEDNFKVREDVIRNKFKIQPGDYVNEDVLKYYQEQVETLQPVSALKYEIKPDEGYELENLDSVEENPFEPSNPLESQITAMKPQKVKLEDVLELSVTEVKKPTLLSILWESASSEVCINLDHTNLGGRCISGMLHARSLDEILVGLSVPSHKTGVLYSFNCTIGSEDLKSNYFEPSDLVDFFINAAARHKYSCQEDLAEVIKTTVKQDPNLPVRGFGKAGVHKLASDWDYIKREMRPIINRYFGFTFMSSIPIVEGSRLSLGLSIKNKSLEYISEDPKTATYKVLSKIDSLGTALNENKTVLKSWSKFSEDEKIDLIISGYKEKENKEITEKEASEFIKSANDHQLQEIYKLGKIERVSLGTGLSPVLKPVITEKIEFAPIVEYKKTFLWSRLNSTIVTFTGKLNPVFGTTSALKTQFMLDIKIPINHLVCLDLDGMLGWSLNSHYLDNFKARDLGICQSIGPVELYNFIELGGKFMTRLKARLFYSLEIDPMLVLYPNISLSWGGLSNSGIEPRRIHPSILKARKWPENSLDIAQNGFTPVVVLSPGARMKLGPIMLGLKFNTKLAGDSDLNLVRPIDLEFGFQL